MRNKTVPQVSSTQFKRVGNSLVLCLAGLIYANIWSERIWPGAVVWWSSSVTSGKNGPAVTQMANRNESQVKHEINTVWKIKLAHQIHAHTVFIEEN